MKAYERLLRYAQISTASAENGSPSPSTARQLDLARVLVQELTELGAQKVRLDEHGYVYAELPATAGLENAPALGFIAHMDTSPAFSGENVRPLEWRAYDGGDICLPNNGVRIAAERFPQLKSWRGRTVITADGTTLLGADDKAGIAEIMTAAQRLLDEEIPHGRFCIAFTPDEEIGAGARDFDIEGFGADYAYTVDGDEEGSINCENFNAATAVVEIEGVSTHPGSAKDVMVNALLLAAEINALLPEAERPEHTQEREGFFMLMSINGDNAFAKAEYIIRDHDAEKFAARKKMLVEAVRAVSARYPAARLRCRVDDSYYNMRDALKDCMHLVANAQQACRQAGVEPDIQPIRGGTDGAQLSYRGLPCPNLGTGGINFHGPYECITVEGMDICTDIILNLVRIYAQNGAQ